MTQPRRWRSSRRPWRANPQPQDGGFALLLAMLGGLALLLSSLSVQTTALQSRASEQRLLQRRQHDDALFTASQLVAGQLRRHSCLLTLPLSQWSGASAAACSTAEARQELIEGRLPGADGAAGRFRLVNYLPASGPEGSQRPAAELELEWLPAAGGVVRRRVRLEAMAMAAPQQPSPPQEQAGP